MDIICTCLSILTVGPLFLPESDKYPFLTEYQYQILFGYHKYYLVLRKSEY